MEKYSEYKDSGIEWLGDIPEYWQIKRLKEISKKISSGATPLTSNAENYDRPTINWINTGDLNNGLVSKSKRKISKKALINYPNLKTFEKGTLIIALYGATIGKLGILGIKATTNQACCCINFKNDQPVNFIFYWLLSNKENIISLSVGGTQPNISQSIINKLKISLPPLQEQIQIANYLDAKTKTIDQKINLLEQKITNYKAYRKTLINETVTKGLDKSVKLKDSGIDWIGEIPEHWEVRRLKDLIKSFVGGGTPSTGNPEYWCEDTDDGYPWVSISDITKSELIKSTKKYVTDKGITNSSTSLIKKNTILYSIYASLGKVALTKVDCATNQAILAIIENEELINKDFFIYVLKNLEDYVYSLGNTNTQNNISLGILRIIKTVIPSNKSEQKRIAEYLDSKTATIDKIVKNIEAQITTLKELRKTLINEVVTGNVKVVN